MGVAVVAALAGLQEAVAAQTRATVARAVVAVLGVAVVAALVRIADAVAAAGGSHAGVAAGRAYMAGTADPPGLLAHGVRLVQTPDEQNGAGQGAAERAPGMERTKLGEIRPE